MMVSILVKLTVAVTLGMLILNQALLDTFEINPSSPVK